LRSIFISYRRDDSAPSAQLLQRDLRTAFGDANIFIDLQDIALGRDFRRVVQTEVDCCGVMLVVIGKGWVDAKNKDGERRLDDVNDWVRYEITQALSRNIPVVPVLVAGGQMPPTDALPEELKALTWRQRAELTVERWASDVNELIERLRPLVHPRHFAKARRDFSGSSGITWQQYLRLFDVDGYRVAYITLVNDWKQSPKLLERTDLQLVLRPERFSLPLQWSAASVPPNTYDGACCRLVAYRVTKGQRLQVTLQETGYFDYLRSGEYLDAPFPSDPKITNREAFGRIVETRNGELWPFEALTNICGTGIFLISTATESRPVLLATRHPRTSHVYPGRWTFSASGVMAWGASPHPFDEAVRRCDAELQHQIDTPQLRLVGFGADARKLYFQFSFVERTSASFDELLKKRGHRADQIRELPWCLEEIVDRLVNDCWEPAAEAALLSLCARDFGREEVSRALYARRALWEKREMRDEFDYRASRPGEFPDMSLRYAPQSLGTESQRYVDCVMDFVREKVRGKNVVEIGPGTGRITERLIEIAGCLTCVDFCEQMMTRCERRLGPRFANINYVPVFAQEYFPQHKHDVALCSLVLIHNVDPALFRSLIERLCNIADTVFAFEDVTVERKTSPRTRLRSRNELCAAFISNNYRVADEDEFQLFEDTIVFLQFVRDE
jgi:hypothetical protein